MHDQVLVIDNTVSKGIAYLHQHQYPNGEFCCYIGHEDHLKDCIPYSNVFPTSLICYSLLKLSHIKEVREILDLSSAFLQFQSMRAGVWNNFTSWHPLFPLCPADVDNTACASKVLQSLRKEYPENKKILLANRNKAGLFYTWYTLRPNHITDKDYWLLVLREFKHPIQSILFWKKFECNRNDIDAVVNANALFYLGLSDDTRPILDYLIKIIEENNEENCDLWYRNPFTIYYFISRNYSAGIIELASVNEKIVSRIISSTNNDGSFGMGILDTALGIISLLHIGYDASLLYNAIAFLISKQHVNGEWSRWALYYGGPKKLSCFGSEEMTTGFCLEALTLYKERI